MDDSIRLTPETRLVRKDTPFATQVEDETVILSLETDRYYGFGRVGTRIWELLLEPISFGALCARLQEEYRVDKETCAEDAGAFLRQLFDEKLIEAVE